MSRRTLSARCPAKINLTLRVLARREDGYHELDTVFQAIDLWDRLEIRPADAWSMSCNRKEIPLDDRNLVLRAAKLLIERHGTVGQAAAFRLEKGIPHGAGLGGGSSDAAGSLVLCNEQFRLGLDRAELARLGAEVGADVPFFLTGGTARGLGRGDRIEPLEFAGELPLILGWPPFGISTAEVFGKVAERLTLPGNGVSVPLLSALKWPEENDFGFLANDLEAVVFVDWPELERFRDALLGAGARAALLSGSGSTVYGIFPERGGLRAVRGRLQSEFPDWRVTVCRAVDGGIRLPDRGGTNGETSWEG